MADVRVILCLTQCSERAKTFPHMLHCYTAISIVFKRGIPHHLEHTVQESLVKRAMLTQVSPSSEARYSASEMPRCPPRAGRGEI